MSSFISGLRFCCGCLCCCYCKELLFFLKFLRNLGTSDPSDAQFAAGVQAWKKYEATRESKHLAAAVRNHQAALRMRSSGHPRRPKSLFHTGMALWAQCQGDVTKESSSTVIAYYEEALSLLPRETSPKKALSLPFRKHKHGRRAAVYTNLGKVYLVLFHLGKENPEAFPATDSNIDQAIENYRSALQLRRNKDDPHRPISLIDLSIALVERNGKGDLMNAIINLREAEELCTTDSTRRPFLLLSLNNLARAYDGHYHYSKDISDVVGKVDVLRRVLDLTDEGKGRLISLVNLTNALCRLFEIEPNRSNDLDEAVLRGREALKLSDNSDSVIHIKALTTLANVLYARYVQISPKNVTDLDQAIQYYREAMDPDPGDGPDPILCSSLASAIYIRCQGFEEVEGATLEDAISYSQEALRTCPTDDPLYLRIQNNLESMTKFNKSGTEGDLVKGIQAYEDVVSHCPDDDHDCTYYRETPEDAKRFLQDKRKGSTDKLAVLTGHQSTSVMTRSRSSQSLRPSFNTVTSSHLSGAGSSPSRSSLREPYDV